DRQRKAGVEEYEWHTTGMGSVRENHAKLNGKRFRYDDPPMGGGTTEHERGNPGEGIGCMCQAIPVIPEFEPGPDDAFRTGQLDVSDQDVFSLSKTTPDTLRDGSLEYLRTGGTARPQAPIAFDVYPDTGMRLADGRHRITVAREQGVKTVAAEVREYNSAGRVTRKRTV